jgi:tRNA U34 5-methylaminomethyl-2-thiouridine-forming methyltransferase MnmC
LGGETENTADIVWHEGDMPYSPRFDDHYYSRDDGRAECAHVFLAGNGLPERWQARRSFTIAELGFGTGLNVAETWRRWRIAREPGATLDIVSFERFPLPRDAMATALARWPELAEEAVGLAAAWPSRPPADDVAVALDAQTRLTVLIGDAMEGLARWTGRADAWFLDGFAPSRNPEMWSAELMRLVARKTAPGGTFATYSAAGWVRRNLAAAGFDVEKRPGHGGKRDMTRGTLR